MHLTAQWCMIEIMEQMTMQQARDMLDDWSRMMRDRDRRVIAASDAGITKLAISERMGIGRNTVYAILRKHREQAGEA